MVTTTVPLQRTLPYLTIDIETTDSDPDTIEAWFRNSWSPTANWKPETIGNRYIENLAKAKEKSALADTAPITMIAIKHDHEWRGLHCCTIDPIDLGGDVQAMPEGFESERDMLVAFRIYLDFYTDDNTIIVGHNITGFDLRKLRVAYLRNNLRLPTALGPDQPVFDSMREYCKYFSVDAREKFMISVADLCTNLGIDHHKNMVDGAMAPDLYNEGKFSELILYGLLDVHVEEQIYLRMTGQQEGMN